ncbi:hypothetical protein JTE90_014531 [Oedothorax gibbosus]|uniref:PHD finger protein 12 n=1 Tax=Oedothorax gibbosus TaxID=931172 RepID=A0AAV6UYU9_9ARAC|nr:hypothetical protein JTE90_014531 [Oedothorax gibbosus]
MDSDKKLFKIPAIPRRYIEDTTKSLIQEVQLITTPPVESVKKKSTPPVDSVKKKSAPPVDSVKQRVVAKRPRHPNTEVQLITAPPVDSVKKKRVVAKRPSLPKRTINRDTCDFCNERGDLLCCDKCPASFHLMCCEPPLMADDIPTGEWICSKCSAKERKVALSAIPAGHPLDALLVLSSGKNNVFELPTKLACRLPRTGTKKKPKPEKTRKKTKKKTYKKTKKKTCKTRKIDKKPAPEYETRLAHLPANNCFICKRNSQKVALIQCDCCPLLFHLDCLDPPLQSFPVGKWLCPNHVEHHVSDLTFASSLSMTRRTKIWNKFKGPVKQEAVRLKFVKEFRKPFPPFKSKGEYPLENNFPVPGIVYKHYKFPPPYLPRVQDPIPSSIIRRASSTVSAQESSEYLRNISKFQIEAFARRKEVKKALLKTNARKLVKKSILKAIDQNQVKKDRLNSSVSRRMKKAKLQFKAQKYLKIALLKANIPHQVKKDILEAKGQKQVKKALLKANIPKQVEKDILEAKEFDKSIFHDKMVILKGEKEYYDSKYPVSTLPQVKKAILKAKGQKQVKKDRLNSSVSRRMKKAKLQFKAQKYLKKALLKANILHQVKKDILEAKGQKQVKKVLLKANIPKQVEKEILEAKEFDKSIFHDKMVILKGEKEYYDSKYPVFSTSPQVKKAILKAKGQKQVKKNILEAKEWDKSIFHDKMVILKEKEYYDSKYPVSTSPLTTMSGASTMPSVLKMTGSLKVPGTILLPTSVVSGIEKVVNPGRDSKVINLLNGLKDLHKAEANASDCKPVIDSNKTQNDSTRSVIGTTSGNPLIIKVEDSKKTITTTHNPAIIKTHVVPCTSIGTIINPMHTNLKMKTSGRIPKNISVMPQQAKLYGKIVYYPRALTRIIRHVTAEDPNRDDVQLKQMDSGLMRLCAYEYLKQFIPKKETLAVKKEKHLQAIQTPAPTVKAILVPLDGFGEPVTMTKKIMHLGFGVAVDLCFNKFGCCKYVSAKHATIFYDEYSRQYELLNYSCHGTTVDNVHYSSDTFIKKPQSAKDKEKDLSNAVHLLYNNSPRLQAQVPTFQAFGTSVTKENQARARGCCCPLRPHDLAPKLAMSGCEGSALLYHGSYLKFGCLQFVFSIVDRGFHSQFIKPSPPPPPPPPPPRIPIVPYIKTEIPWW